MMGEVGEFLLPLILALILIYIFSYEILYIGELSGNIFENAI